MSTIKNRAIAVALIGAATYIILLASFDAASEYRKINEAQSPPIPPAAKQKVVFEPNPEFNQLYTIIAYQTSDNDSDLKFITIQDKATGEQYIVTVAKTGSSITPRKMKP